MRFRQAKRGFQFILTAKGEASMTDRAKLGAVSGQPIRGRETSVPERWVRQKYVIEVPV